MKYVAKQTVNAVQWTGDNLDEMRELLEEILGAYEVDVYAEYIEPYFISSLGNSGGYNMLKFYAGDDYEVDPGNWVVVYDDLEVEIMDNDEFNRMFEEA
jgi:ABC-type nitrate/sulfonate/bicarbonate transport system substrate-binding protein